MRNPNFHIPEELVIEICSRLPTKSVGRCRCLSKSWRTNLSTPQFVKLHLTRKPANTEDLIYRICTDYYLHLARITLDGGNDTALVSRKLDMAGGHGYNVIGSCNGLILLQRGRRGEEILVLNPITLQQLGIRDTDLSSPAMYGFGYDSRLDDYKIVKITSNHGEPPTDVHVYALKEGDWRRLNNYPYSHGYYISYTNVVFLNGAIHWLASSRVDHHVVIVAFDLVTESFREIPAHSSISKLPLPVLYAIGGCLVVLLGPDHRRVFIMKEYGQVNSWISFSIPASAQLGRGTCRLRLLFFIGRNEVVFVTSTGILIVRNLAEGTVRTYTNVAENIKFIIINTGYAFVDSLVSPIQ